MISSWLMSVLIADKFQVQPYFVVIPHFCSPAVPQCEVSCPFCKLRAPESAEEPRRACCAAEQAGHPVLKENAP